jgi:hypothetical protein
VALYERTMKQLLPELPAIYEDVRKRSEVMARVANNLETAMTTIHTHLIGAVPFVYYESFIVWRVRSVMMDLSIEMSGLVYLRLAEALDQRLMSASDRLANWRELYEKKKHLLR